MDEKMFRIDRERHFQTRAMENLQGLFGDAVVQRDGAERQNWKGSGNGIRNGGGGLEEERDYKDDEDVDEEGQEDERLVDEEGECKISTNNFKSSASGVSLNVNHQQGKDNQFQNVLPIAAVSEDGYYAQVVNGSEVPALRRMFMTESGSASSIRKEAPLYESVRSILSDPFTGELMDDAVIFPCGHSFGTGGLQHSLQKKACFTCSLPITEDSVHGNLTLRTAVAAFRKEEYDNRSLKRRRDRFEEKADFSDSNHMDSPGSRFLQFPFAVADRVMIVGNKRTPQHVVGREAIITAQCLNGWYVVKTLDDAKSVKLQYRSLAKIPNDLSMSKKANRL